MGCISAHGMADLHKCEGTINAECVKVVLYFSQTRPNRILHVLQLHGYDVRVKLTSLQSRSLCSDWLLYFAPFKAVWPEILLIT